MLVRRDDHEARLINVGLIASGAGNMASGTLVSGPLKRRLGGSVGQPRELAGASAVRHG